jgi:hypothetical protein
MTMAKKHVWLTVNREVHSPDFGDIGHVDVIEELSVVLAGMEYDDLQKLVRSLDDGYYEMFGRLISDALRQLQSKVK